MMLTFRNSTILFFSVLCILNLFRFAELPVNTATFIWIGLYLTIPVILSFLPCSGYHHRPVICRGSSATNAIAITFDDGPDPVKTPLILDILRRYDTRATFFMTGQAALRNRDLVLRIATEGHLIGNHSFSHGKWWAFLPPRRMAAEIEKTNDVIQAITGNRPLFFRPPYGVINPMVHTALGQVKMKVMIWNRRSLDTLLVHPGKVLCRVTAKLSAGDIVLFHDTAPVLLSVLPEFLETVGRKGLKSVRLDELIKDS